MTPDFLFNLRTGADLDWDIETFPNVFTAFFLDRLTGHTWYFEISEFRNDLVMFCKFIDSCMHNSIRWIGFNSLNFDYPVVDFIYDNQRACIGVADIYLKSMEIINSPFGSIGHIIWGNAQLVPQIDLFKIHHFDSFAKSTGLKVLEFNMHCDRVEDLPFPVGTVLNEYERDKLAWYNEIDVRATSKFAAYSAAAIQMRVDLMEEFPSLDLMNKSDVKIGEMILIELIERQGIKTTVPVDGRKRNLQTHRTEIAFKDVIFPYINFSHPSFKAIHEKLHFTVMRGKEIEEAGKDDTELTTKGLFKGLIANIDGVEYKFGTGGLHGSINSKIVRSTNDVQLVDIDVSSYYPNLGIKNGLYPEHLTKEFCVAYEQIYRTRQSYAKGTPENEAYKLALNGSYGKSNSKYSALFDPQYTMAITINGQLLLAMLIEQMIKIPGLKMVQANTDGITYLCPRVHLEHTLKIIDWWEAFTKLELEEVHYESMFIRDVNSYIAVKEDGKIKRIGAYAYETAATNPGTRELPWHKDWSFRIVPIAAEAVLVRGADLRKFLAAHSDVYDFFGRTKVPRSSKLVHGGKRVPNIVRYYVSTNGKPLQKVMPASGPLGEHKRANKLTDFYFQKVLDEIGLGVWDERIHTKNKSVYAERKIGINTGWKVSLINNLKTTEGEEAIRLYDEIDYEFYVKEVEKLINLTEV